MAHTAKLADGNRWSNNRKPSKLNTEDRVAWADSNMSRLLAIGEAVRRGEVPKDIDGIDEPIQFIAACHELALAGNDPNFETHLPITLDGRCNGLQHLCLMTRSEDAKYAGLCLPSEEPDEDFYERVAASANKSFTNRWFVKFKNGKDKKGKDKIELKFFPTEAERDDFASTVDIINSNSKYIDVEIDRAIAKQPVMSFFYGATRHGMTKQVAKFLKDNALPATGASKIAKAIYDAVKQVAPDAVAVRSFLEELSDLYYDHGKEMRWPNVFGVPIINISGEPVMKRPSKKINGRARRSSVKVGETDVSKATARQSIIANYVHSWDASLLQMVARHVGLEGIPMVAVHDSFGFLADVPSGRRAALYYFSQMYEYLHPLHDLLEQAKKDLPPGTKLPKLPKFGKLARAKTVQSEAFR
jgi:DNA-directed RNA polymerase